ncbi:MAG: glycosyltransferase family 2 protein [Isosphaeraceae bacterium]
MAPSSGHLRPASAGACSESPREGSLSVVVPARNEAANLVQLVDEIVASCRLLCRQNAAGRPSSVRGFELLIVDDASMDETASVLEQLRSAVPELRVLCLKANAGQSAALLAGIRAAEGEWIATLDADLQNDPADLPRLWDALGDHDAALGWRRIRRDRWSRRAVSRAANLIRNAVLKQSIRDTGCAIRIFRRADALTLPPFHGMHRFLGPLLLRQGCRVVQIAVNHRPRGHGRSHYNLWNRSWRVVIDLFGVAWLMRRAIRYEVVEPMKAGHTLTGRHHHHQPVQALSR